MMGLNSTVVASPREKTNKQTKRNSNSKKCILYSLTKLFFYINTQSKHQQEGAQWDCEVKSQSDDAFTDNLSKHLLTGNSLKILNWLSFLYFRFLKRHATEMFSALTQLSFSTVCRNLQFAAEIQLLVEILLKKEKIQVLKTGCWFKVEKEMSCSVGLI